MGWLMDFLAQILGTVLNQIFNIVDSIGIPGSLGITIVLFTIFVRVILLPLMINQQVSMKRMQKIQPEIKKIQDKYKDKKDPESQKKMSQELGEFYKKNKVNPLGGCLPLLIQMPIFFALFRVLRQAGTYIAKLSDIYNQLAVKIMSVSGYQNTLQSLLEGKVRVKLDETTLSTSQGLQSVLTQLTTKEWTQLTETFGNISQNLISKKESIETFLGISLVDSPKDLMGQGVPTTVLIAIILFPIISGLTTFISSKIMAMGNTQQNEQALQTQRTMNMIFPLLTGWMTFTLPAGLGIYWITSNIFQIVQQLVINKYVDKSGEGE